MKANCTWQFQIDLTFIQSNLSKTWDETEHNIWNLK